MADFLHWRTSRLRYATVVTTTDTVLSLVLPSPASEGSRVREGAGYVAFPKSHGPRTLRTSDHTVAAGLFIYFLATRDFGLS